MAAVFWARPLAGNLREARGALPSRHAGSMLFHRLPNKVKHGMKETGFESMTIGLGRGDRFGHYGEIVCEEHIRMTQDALTKRFE